MEFPLRDLDPIALIQYKIRYEEALGKDRKVRFEDRLGARREVLKAAFSLPFLSQNCD